MKINTNPKLDVLARARFFRRLSKGSLRDVASIADELDVPEGTRLTIQGERAREVFVLVNGAAKVCEDGELVRELGPGEVVGELAVLGDVPRTATVTTTEPSRILVLTDRDFRRAVAAA